MIDVFTIIAWIVLAVLFLVFVAIIVFLGSLPGSIAKKRNHPQADAINAASWIGLALAGTGWPIAFVWAFLKHGPIGSDSSIPTQTASDSQYDATDTPQEVEPANEQNELASIAASLASIERRLTTIEQHNNEIKS